MSQSAGYPWSEGDHLLAADLNAAFANSAAISGPPGSTAGWPFLPLSGGTVTGVTYINASLLLGNNNNYPWSGTTQHNPFAILANPVGNYDAQGNFGQINYIGAGGDALAASNSQGISLLHLTENSAPGIAGSRYTLHADMTINHADSLGGSPSHAVFLMTGATGVSQGGSAPHSGQSKGQFFGFNSNVILRSGATNLTGLYACEINVGVATGASTQEKVALQIVKTTSDFVQAGDIESDTALRFGDQFATNIPAWRNGIEFGTWLSQWPFDNTSTLIRARPTSGFGVGAQGYALRNPLANIGIDFSLVKFTTAAAQFPGLSISPAGALSVNSAVISTAGATTTIDTPRSVATAAAIAAGGTGYYAGDVVQSADGTIMTVATVAASPGAVTGITLTVPGYATTPPANPVTFNNGSGSGLTVNLTWTTPTTLSLNPTGHQILTNLSAATTDAAAATAGVPIGGLYNNAGVVHVRLT